MSGSLTGYVLCIWQCPVHLSFQLAVAVHIAVLRKAHISSIFFLLGRTDVRP